MSNAAISISYINMMVIIIDEATLRRKVRILNGDKEGLAG
jgi:hypothetical protein